MSCELACSRCGLMLKSAMVNKIDDLYRIAEQQGWWVDWGTKDPQLLCVVCSVAIDIWSTMMSDADYFRRPMAHRGLSDAEKQAIIDRINDPEGDDGSTT